MNSRGTRKIAALAAACATLSIAASSTARSDQVVLDDMIIQGSECVGIDCVNGENFGADTLRLKENNLRINFFDTSNSASFPSNDWRIVANDQTNGGGNYLAIEDSTAGKIPFLVEAGARASAIYVKGKNVGFGTSTPVTDLHTVSGNTPTLRLEQDGSSGFTSQTWDVAGNEANFFVRDLNSSSALPFRIFPGNTGDSILSIKNNRIGIGTTSPAALLHLKNSGSGATGLPRIEFENADASPTVWDMDVTDNADFRVSVVGSGQAEFLMNSNGNVTVAGTLTQNSDRNAKTDIFRVNDEDILQKVAALDISEWSYKDDIGVRHIGPMAQDFHALFKTGATDKGITTIDTSGVALASIKAINTRLGELDEAKSQINALEEQNRKLSAQIAELNEKLQTIATKEQPRH